MQKLGRYIFIKYKIKLFKSKVSYRYRFGVEKRPLIYIYNYDHAEKHSLGGNTEIGPENYNC